MELTRRLSDPHSLAFAEIFHIGLLRNRREAHSAQDLAENLIAFSDQNGFLYWKAFATIHRGGAIAEQGRGEEGIAQMHQGLGAVRASGAQVNRPDYLAWMAVACQEVGRVDDGLDALSKALAAADENEHRRDEAEVHRLQGEILLRKDHSNVEEARHCFERAIELARKQNAKSWELRATMSLARLLVKQGRRDEARTMLAEIYNWFTEGFDTADLKEAKALLDELHAPPGPSRRSV